jgi:hypothetical protein
MEMREASTFPVPMGLRRVVSIVRAEENYRKGVIDGIVIDIGSEWRGLPSVVVDGLIDKGLD